MVLTQTQTEELFVIYSGGCLPRAGRVRRVPLAARKVETCALRFPAQRTKIRTTKKENFTSCGEATTYQGTFSGVTFRPVSELPLITMRMTKRRSCQPTKLSKCQRHGRNHMLKTCHCFGKSVSRLNYIWRCWMNSRVRQSWTSQQAQGPSWKLA